MFRITVRMFIHDLTFKNVRLENIRRIGFLDLLNGCFVLLIFCVLFFGRATGPFPGARNF